MTCSVASQDAASRGLREEEILYPTHSVVCIFPRLRRIADPHDYKFKTLGYVDFVGFLTTPGQASRLDKPSWSALDPHARTDQRHGGAPLNERKKQESVAQGRPK